jgi:hypothetical protein
MALLATSATGKIILFAVLAALAFLVLLPLVRGSIRLLRDDEPPVPSSWGKQLRRHKDDDDG